MHPYVVRTWPVHHGARADVTVDPALSAEAERLGVGRSSTLEDPLRATVAPLAATPFCATTPKRTRRPGGGRLVGVLQDRRHDALATRSVAPLRPASMLDRPVRGMPPAVMVEGDAWIVATQQMAALAVTEFEAGSTRLAAIARQVLGS